MNNAEVTDVLALTAALIEAGWCKKEYESDYVSGPLGWGYPTRHCLAGALRAAAWTVAEDRERAVSLTHAVTKLIERQLPTESDRGIEYFNDRPATDRPRVLRVIEKTARSIDK